MKTTSKEIQALLEGSYVEVGNPSVHLIFKGSKYRLGGKDLNDEGTYVVAKTDDYTYVLEWTPSNPEWKEIIDKWSLTREKETFFLSKLPDEFDAGGQERIFKRKGKFEAIGLADSANKSRKQGAKPAVDLQPQPVADFLSFIGDWHPEWILIAVESPIERVSKLYASASSAKRTWSNVPVLPPKKNDDMAYAVAVVQAEGSNWSIIYRAMCFPIGSKEVNEAEEHARGFSAKLKTRALAFIGEDTSGAMGFSLYRNGKKKYVKGWESQNDPADEAFQKLGLWVPACYPQCEKKNAVLVALEPWTTRILQADIIDIGEV